MVDNRIAVPSSLRQAVLSHVHRAHPGQQAMIDAVSYLWWPKMHSQIIEKAEKCEACKKYGKNLKPLCRKAEQSDSIEPTCPNEEVQLDFAGPLFPEQTKPTYLLVAIDRFSRYPTVLITHKTTANHRKSPSYGIHEQRT